MQYVGNLKCSEHIAQELGTINASKTLVGSIPIATNFKVTKTLLVLYFMKTTIPTAVGGRDLVTVVAIAHLSVSKTLVLLTLKMITEQYTEFRQDPNLQSPGHVPNVGEFKLHMVQIIKTEENRYDSELLLQANYGLNRPTDSSQDPRQIGPSQLVLAHEEVEEVRQLMLDNITKLLARGDKVSLLVDQTDRLTSSLLLFQRQAQIIQRRRWSKFQWACATSFGVVVIIYVMAASLCGFPSLSKCRR